MFSEITPKLIEGSMITEALRPKEAARVSERPLQTDKDNMRKKCKKLKDKNQYYKQIARSQNKSWKGKSKK